MASVARPSIFEVRSNGLPRCARSDDIFTRRDEIFSYLEIPEKALSQPLLSA